MVQVFDIIMSLYQNCLMIYVLKKQFVQHHHSFLWEVGFVTIPVLDLSLIQGSHLPIPDSLILFSFIFYVIATTHEHFVTCLFWVALDAFLLMGTLSLVSGIFGIRIDINGDNLAKSEEIQVIYSIAGNTAITVVLCLAARIKNTKALIKQKEILIYLFMLLLCFGISECFFIGRVSEQPYPVLLFGSICSFLVMILIVILYERMIQSAHKHQQEKLSAQTALLTSDHLDEVKTVYKQMLSEQHDLRHRISTIEELLSSNNIPDQQKVAALNLLEEDPNHIRYTTGSISIDAILNSKSMMMKNAGITFELTEYPLTQLPIPEQDFCMLISNLLDNAIEGVMRLPASSSSRHIHLSFSRVWNIFFISCSNDADISQIKRIGNKFISTKTSPELHGFGIDSMKKIVGKAGGTIEFEISDKRFNVEISLGGDPPY